MSKFVIFVGDKPSPKMKSGAKPFEGAGCEKRLYKWIEYLIPFDDLDIRGVTKYEIINQEGFDFNGVVDYKMYKWVALGDNASKVLKQNGIPHFKLPHPSGRNRLTNDSKLINLKLDACRNYIYNGVLNERE